MKKLAVLYVLGIVLVSSCKKDNAIRSGASTTYTLSANGDINGTFNGVLLEEYSMPPSISSSAEAIFYNSPTVFHWSAITFVHVVPPTGTVTAVYVNNVKFRFTSVGGLDYKDSTNTLTFPPANWVVNGGSIIPSYSYACNTAIPSYNNTSNLPTTINRSQNLSITTSGFSGYDQIEIDIADNTGHTICMYAPNSAPSVNFPSDSLSKLLAGVGGIAITLVKYNPQLLSSKNFLFLTTSEYDKPGVTLQ